MDATEYEGVLRIYAARALRRKSMAPTAAQAEEAVQLALTRLALPRNTLENLYRNCLREVMGRESWTAPAKAEKPKTDYPAKRRIVRKPEIFGDGNQGNK